MWEYTDKVKEHFLNPRNVGELEGANAVGEVGSLACGDALKLFLKVGDDGRIEDATFQTFGCASAIASSSALTELVKGKTLDEALKLTNRDIAEYLGGLPKEKMHCSVMGQEALEAAIKNYRGEAVDAHEHHEGEIVCKCFGVTDETILKVIRENGLKTVEEVTFHTKAGGGCGDCIPRLQELLAEARGEKGVCSVSKVAPLPEGLTNMQRMLRVQDVMDNEIRPMLQKDGGDIQLVDIDRTRVVVALRGRCTNCPSSLLTVKEVVEKTLREKVDPEITVEERS
ncbi:MAG: Fe-S cluster assembly protein NifU [Desulfovibrionaceae bacterium]|jgi:NifU-like protein|nr:Fe-S cluster assembly protein NifU [Desulfovibrionaceae bacterium]